MRSLVAWVAVISGLVSCSSPDPTPNTRSGDVRTNEVWRDGLQLDGVVRIFEGATVEIEPGAKISCTEAVVIQVGGTLRVNSPGEHASITCPAWRGIQVAQNGSLDVTGLDIENAEVGIETTTGAGSVRVTDAQVLTTTRPFLVAANSTLEVTRVRVTTPTVLGEFEASVSEVFGKLVAKFLHYEANTNEGIMLQKGGEADIEDTTFEGKGALDLLSMHGGAAMSLRYSTLKGAHCGLHFGPSKDDEKRMPGKLEIDHVTSEDNSFGVTIYAASLEGPNVIRNSNIGGASSWIDLQGDHGPLTFENVYVSGPETILNTTPPVITKAPIRIEGAGPRGVF